MELLNRSVMFVTLCLVQILILNHIHLFDVATPLLYVYFVITFQRNTPKWVILVWSFFLGLTIDVFTNTPGLASGAMTLIALLQPYLLELFVPRDSPENLAVSASTLGLRGFLLLCGVLVLLYCLVFFGLETFSIFNWLHWLACAFSSAALTLVLILAIDSVRLK